MKIGNHIIYIESDIMRPCNIRISDVVASADKALAYCDVVRLEHRLKDELKFNLYYKIRFSK